MTKSELENILNGLSWIDAMKELAAAFPGRLAFSSSLGQEDQVITDAIYRHQIPVRVFTLDTGRLFTETYELIERTNARYKQNMEIYFPEAADVEDFVNTKGVNSFYESVENRKTCCYIRKVKPLRRALQDTDVWITGLRSEQSANRKHMSSLEWDEGFGLYKFNPLFDWSYEEVLAYLDKNKVPFNPLHLQGFISIGCQPCTRAIEPGEDPRAGRWWWEDSKKECGLHSHSPK